ncbi:MAG: U32 family peptidase [Ruminococcaceae bacterium]|nr:U32 family peptidase [Oscillospiraceae bacterium]
MKRKEALPELLSPAGSEAALLAAIAGGADAVYLGMREGASNARTLAENFDREQLSRLIPLAHAHGVKIYVTLNTLTYDSEIAEIVSLARFLYEAGADAAIVADLGLAYEIRKAVPRLSLHASTQAFTHSTRTAEALSQLGFSRVVLARELSEDSIREITEKAACETEIFLHGALCVSHSGECLFSSLVGGRSGNRGACAQPCRLPYNGTYPLSLKDYSLARHIPALIDSGVASLKIEGRMKSPAYVFGVTRIFRRLLDEGRPANDDEMTALARIFSRDGFTDGYFTGNLTSMGGVRREEDKQSSRTEDVQISPLPPIPLTARAVLKQGRPASLLLSFTAKNGKRYTATAEGSMPEPAQNAALTPENVKDRLAKLGGTGFALAEIDLALDEGLFLPVGALNALRRDAVAALTRALAECEEESHAAPLPLPAVTHTEEGKPLHTAHIYRADTFAAMDTSGFDITFLSLEAAASLPTGAKIPNGVALPPVLFDREEALIRPTLLSLAAKGVKYALVSSVGQISLARECGLVPFGDLRLNIANRPAAALYRSMGLVGFLASAECTPAAARALSGAVVSYGRLPLMLTERCFVKELYGCDACGTATLTDRRGVAFPVIREYPHRCLVVNSLPTYLADTKALDAPLATHMIFTVEEPKEALAVLCAYRARTPLPYPVRRAFK